MISIFVNLRHVLSPNPSAMPRVTFPLPTVHVVAFQHANALPSWAAVGAVAARVRASLITGWSVPAAICAAKALSIVACTWPGLGAAEADAAVNDIAAARKTRITAGKRRLRSRAALDAICIETASFT